MTPGLVRGIPKVANPGTAAAFLAVLTSQIGYREGENNDNLFGAWYGMPRTAWCAQFQSWGAAFSGCAKIIPKFAYTPSGAAWFRDHGQWHSSPKVGDLGFVYGNGPRIHHVFAVLSVAGDHVITIEGNTNNTGSATGNGVYSLRRLADLGPHGGYGRPKYKTAAPKPAKPKVSLKAIQDQARHGRITDDHVAAAMRAKGQTATREGYAALQMSWGYRGHDADGIPGPTTFARLAKETGLFEVAP